MFRIPDVDAVGKPSVDLRHPSPAGSALVGPQVAFGSGDAQNHIFVRRCELVLFTCLGYRSLVAELFAESAGPVLQWVPL